jgi:hypothetical protein
VVRLLPTTVLLDVFRGDVQDAVVPREVDLVAVEPRQFDREDELVFLLVQFVVGTTGVAEDPGGEIESLRLVAGRTSRQCHRFSPLVPPERRACGH